MVLRLIFAAIVCAAAVCSQDVKAKSYVNPEGCLKTYHLATGRILTSQGLIEDPTVNGIVKEAVAAQMNKLNIAQLDKGADLEVRFMGGNGAGLQVDSLSMGDMMMWDIGGPQAVPGRTYKKTTLVIGIVENKSNRTLWAARCTDKFGDPNKMRERIDKAIAKAFAKFPKKAACS
jgi:hypothetical protein